MFNRTFSGVMIALLFLSVIMFAFNIQPARANTQTIYINADGSITPAGAPIVTSDRITYTFIDSMGYPTYLGIVVQRNNVVINGNGYTLYGNQSGYGLDLTNVNNVTIKNTNVRRFDLGIILDSSSNNSIIRTNITENSGDGIYLRGWLSEYNTISGNMITNNYRGIALVDESRNNSIIGNIIAANSYLGMWIKGSYSNSIIGNNIAENTMGGIGLNVCHGNSIIGNSIRANQYGGIWLAWADGYFFHNNFANSEQLSDYMNSSETVLNDGYPSGGNYWSDYTGVDFKSGPNQDQPGSDGIGDTPYTIDVSNVDHYPLMRPWGSPPVAQSSTFIVCSPNPVSVGSSITCTATVSGLDPTGTVTWSTSSSTGSFSEKVYILSFLSSGSCSTTYTDTSPGIVTITANYLGDSINTPSSGSTTLIVSAPLPTYSVTLTAGFGGSVTYSYSGGLGTVLSGESQLLTVSQSGQVSLVASPDSMHVFQTWEASGPISIPLSELSSASTTATVNGNGDVTADFLSSNTYDVVFRESGLAPGTLWSVTFDGHTSSSTLDAITFIDAANGVHEFHCVPPIGYTSPISQIDGSITVNGQTVTDPITFTICYVSATWDMSRDSYYYTHNQGTDWYSGMCFGLSSTAVNYFMHYRGGLFSQGDSSYPCFPSQNSEASSTSDLDLSGFWGSNGKLNNASLAVMFHQVYGQYELPPITGSDVNENEQYSYLLANLTENQPVVLALGNVGWPHAAVAWKVGSPPANVDPAVNVGIYLYDSNMYTNIPFSIPPATMAVTMVATYNLATQDFSYTGGDGVFVPYFSYTKFYVVNPAAMPPRVSGNPLYSLGNGTQLEWWRTWVDKSVPGYDILMARVNVAIVDSNGLKDCFTGSDSQTFVCGIPGSSGIEEERFQVYAIPNSAGAFSVEEVTTSGTSACSERTVVSAGSVSIDQTPLTGVMVDIGGSSAPDGTSVTITTTKLTGAPTGAVQVQVGTIPAAYYDVSVEGISDGIARVCITNGGVCGPTIMQYLNGARWVEASDIVVSGNTIWGNIPVSALGGTTIVIGPLRFTITFDERGIGLGSTGTVLTIDGTNYTASDLPASLLWDSGSTHTFAFQSPLIVDSGAKEYDWTSTTGLSTLQTDSITVNGAGNVTGNYMTRVHDVAVTSVVAVVPHCSSKVGNDSWVFQGRPVYVNVTVLNKGYFDENVTVTLYYNITANQIVGAQNMTLSPGQNETAAFVWDTNGVPYCLNYTLTAVATASLDISPADNTQACGPITVRIMGDVNGDGKVDGKDIALVALAFGSCGADFLCKGSLPSVRWNLDCDISCDNRIDGKDIVLVALKFGK